MTCLLDHMYLQQPSGAPPLLLLPTRTHPLQKPMQVQLIRVESVMTGAARKRQRGTITASKLLLLLLLFCGVGERAGLKGMVEAQGRCQRQ